MSVIYPRVRYNRLRRIIATFDIFDTNPTDPANMTDEDWTTETGEGIETVTVATGLNRTVGNIIFDMGAIYAVTIFALVNMHRASGDGNIGLSIDFSSDASTWLGVGSYSINIKSLDYYYPMFPVFGYGRYMRLRFTSSSVTVDPSVFHVKAAEVMALEFI